MGESNPLNGSSRVARCRNCRGMQPHVKDTWFPWDSAKMWSCCSSLQMFQRLWSHEPQGSLACVPAVNCRNPLERKIQEITSSYGKNLKKLHGFIHPNGGSLACLPSTVWILIWSKSIGLTLTFRELEYLASKLKHFRLLGGSPSGLTGAVVLTIATQLAWGFVQFLRLTSAANGGNTLHLTWLFHVYFFL